MPGGEAFWTLVGVVAAVWVGGSLAFAALIPWRWLDRDDRWLAWTLVLAWPIVIGWMIAELLLERRSR